MVSLGTLDTLEEVFETALGTSEFLSQTLQAPDSEAVNPKRFHLDPC